MDKPRTRKVRNLKFIDVDGHLFNIDNIIEIYKANDERICIRKIDGNYDYYEDSFESIKKKLESITF